MAALAVLGVVAAEAGPGPPGTSLYLLAFKAASQSKGDRIDRALQGVIGDARSFLFEHAGEAGTFRLGKVRLDGGADMGSRGPVPSGLVGMAALLSAAVLGAGGGGVVIVGRLSFSFSDSVDSFPFASCSLFPHLQLRSVFSEAAVVGALSASGSDAEESAVVVVLTDCIDSEVDVLFIGVLPVNGGDCREMDLRKSKYAKGGVMGVFSSCLIRALIGCIGEHMIPADGRPAEGSPAEGKGSRNLDKAERGVVAEMADGISRSTSVGKLAVLGVASDKVGLALTETVVLVVAMMLKDDVAVPS